MFSPALFFATAALARFAAAAPASSRIARGDDGCGCGTAHEVFVNLNAKIEAKLQVLLKGDIKITAELFVNVITEIQGDIYVAVNHLKAIDIKADVDIKAHIDVLVKLVLTILVNICAVVNVFAHVALIVDLIVIVAPITVALKVLLTVLIDVCATIQVNVVEAICLQIDAHLKAVVEGCGFADVLALLNFH